MRCTTLSAPARGRAGVRPTGSARRQRSPMGPSAHPAPAHRPRARKRRWWGPSTRAHTIGPRTGERRGKRRRLRATADRTDHPRSGTLERRDRQRIRRRTNEPEATPRGRCVRADRRGHPARGDLRGGPDKAHPPDRRQQDRPVHPPDGPAAGRGEDGQRRAPDGRGSGVPAGPHPCRPALPRRGPRDGPEGGRRGCHEEGRQGHRALPVRLQRHPRSHHHGQAGLAGGLLCLGRRKGPRWRRSRVWWRSAP